MLGRARHYRTAGKDDLTPRQREVLQLVAEGKTNPEIAERLGITLDGAKFHIREILAKLDVESREEAAEWWREQRGVGTRVASFLRALVPATWLKPAAIGTVIGGTTLGVVAVGFAVNGGGDDAVSGPALPDCDPASLTWETGSVSHPDPAVGLRFGVAARPLADCELNAVIELRAASAQQVGTGFTVIGASMPLSITIEGQSLLASGATSLIAGFISNECHGTPKIMLMLSVAEGRPYFLDAPPPPCLDATQPLQLKAGYTPSTAEPDHVSEPDSPACDPLRLKGWWAYDVDPDRGMRWTWAVEAPERCILSMNQHAAVTVTFTGPAAPTDPYLASTRLAGQFLYQELGVGRNTIFVGTLKNACGGEARLHFAFELSQAKDSRDMGPAPYMCTDASRPAQLEAHWAVFSSGIPRYDPPLPITPVLPPPTTDAFFQIYAAIDGDTVASFAGRYWLNESDIIAANPGIGTGAIPAGTRVRVPIRPQDPPAIPTP